MFIVKEASCFAVMVLQPADCAWLFRPNVFSWCAEHGIASLTAISFCYHDES